MLIVDPHRPHDLIERTFKTALILRRDGDHVEQLPVPQLRRDQPDDLRTSCGFISVCERRDERRATIERSSCITATRAQVVVPLREVVNQLLGRTLQVAAITLRHTEARAVRVNRLAVGLAVSTLRHKPHRATLVHLPPVARHADVHTTVEDRNALVTRRWIRNAPAGRIVRIVAVAGLLANRITLSAALDLGHGGSGSGTPQSLLNTRKIARITIA